MKYKKNATYALEMSEDEVRAIYECLYYAEQCLIKDELGRLTDKQYDSIISLVREFRDLV